MMRHDCGCINEVHEPTGILHCIAKCDHHARLRRDPATLGEAYYRENGSIGGPHLEELRRMLGPFPAAFGSRRALEIGCGASPYAGAIEAAGWSYVGLDSSRWATIWTSIRWDVSTAVGDWEEWTTGPVCGLVLAVHVIEHLRDAPAGIAKMAMSLIPGGELWIVVPDDSDPCNPDHEWMFSRATLERAVERVGLEVMRFATLKVIERETFMYLRARKPS